MAYTTIKKPSDYFNTKIYTGNGSTQSISSVGFQPDLTWLKVRLAGSGQDHTWYDSVRGATKFIESNTTNAEATGSNYLTSFDSDGFTLGNDQSHVNASGDSYASWNWLGANGTASNTDGSITSTVSANTTSGFSIVSYTGNGTGNSTIGHGLGATPKFIIVKNRTTAQQWGTYSPSFVSASEPRILYLSNTASYANDTNVWGTSASFNNNTFTVGDWNGSNQSGSNFIAYCFADVKGFSKFGNYTGNGSTDGTFVYTGFKPAWLLIKGTNVAASWRMVDNKRNTFNVMDKKLSPPSANAESTETICDFLSNGFKMKSTDGAINGSGNNFIYMAFAEEPLVGDNPATAR